MDRSLVMRNLPCESTEEDLSLPALLTTLQQSQHDIQLTLHTLQHDLRDVLFLLRSMRVALYNQRVEVSEETQRIHCNVLRMEPFNGRCPCCLETRVVSGTGKVIPPAEFDHFLGQVYSAPVHSWLICQPCHQDLTNDQHLSWYRHLTTRFRTYQAAVEAYTRLFGRRTPARIYPGPSERRHSKHSKQG